MKQYHTPDLKWVFPSETDVIRTSAMIYDSNGNNIYSEVFGDGTW